MCSSIAWSSRCQICCVSDSWFQWGGATPWLEPQLCTPRTLRFELQEACFLQLVSGLAFMHAKNFVHGDVKPGNVLIDHSRFKFCNIDFGLTMELPVKEDLLRSCSFYSTAFRAPELCPDQKGDGSIMLSPLCDSWACGLTILESGLGRHFFEGTSTMNVISNIKAFAEELWLPSARLGVWARRLQEAMSFIYAPLRDRVFALIQPDFLRRAPCSKFSNIYCLEG